MSEQRRINKGQQLRRNQFKFQERRKESKNKCQMSKRVTYTQDNQTTDCTKQSTEFRNLRWKGIEETLKDLQRENEELKNEIISLKTEQFVKINEEKLKELLHQNQYLKKEIVDQRLKIDEIEIEKQFLVRSNSRFRLECENLRKSMNYFKNKINREVRDNSKGSGTSNSDIDEICRSIYRSASNKILLNRKKRKSQMEDKKSQEESFWNNDYYGSKKRKQKEKQRIQK